MGNKAVLASLLGISCIFVRQAEVYYDIVRGKILFVQALSDLLISLICCMMGKKVECVNFSPNTHEGCIENISKYLGNFIRILSCFFFGPILHL